MDLGVGCERKRRVRMTLGFWLEQLEGQSPSSQIKVEPVWAECPGLVWEPSPSCCACLGKGTNWG